jgi:chitin disaccharide deacetylase
MCQATLTALADLFDFGLVSSAAVMVPCAWFPSLAKYCREHPQADVGVHTTLNCEWTAYRWGALSTCDPASGLLDGDGYMHQWPPATDEHATPQAVQAEIQAQLQRALAAGVDVTHIDTHMGTVAHPKFAAGYIQLALQHRLPAMIPRMDAASLEQMGLDPVTAAAQAAVIQQLEEQGVPMIDAMVGMPLDQPEGQLEIAKKLLSELPAGVTHFVLHPAADTPELRALAPDWASRAANYQTFLSPELRDFVRNIGIQVIGYRALRNILRKANIHGET